MRRSLSNMIAEIGSGLLGANAQGTRIRVRSIVLDLPIEVRFDMVPGGLDVFADVPVWRWRTDFDHPLSRLALTLAEEEPA